MTTELRDMTLYPHFSPVVAKLAGASGVKTFKAWRRFRWRASVRWAGCAVLRQHVRCERSVFGELVRVRGELQRVQQRLRQSKDRCEKLRHVRA